MIYPAVVAQTDQPDPQYFKPEPMDRWPPFFDVYAGNPGDPPDSCCWPPLDELLPPPMASFNERWQAIDQWPRLHWSNLEPLLRGNQP